MWTFLGSARAVKGPVKRLGINFGAPGDRVDDDGTPWLEYPPSAGPSPKINVETEPDDLEYFRRHATTVTGPLPWVTASGVKGVRSVTVAPTATTRSRRRKGPPVLRPPAASESRTVRLDVALQGRTVSIARRYRRGRRARRTLAASKGVRAGEALSGAEPRRSRCVADPLRAGVDCGRGRKSSPVPPLRGPRREQYLPPPRVPLRGFSLLPRLYQGRAGSVHPAGASSCYTSTAFGSSCRSSSPSTGHLPTMSGTPPTARRPQKK